MWHIYIFTVSEKYIIYLTVERKKTVFGLGFLSILCFNKCLNFVSFLVSRTVTIHVILLFKRKNNISF